MILFSDFLKENYIDYINTNNVFNQHVIAEWLDEIKKYPGLNAINLNKIYNDFYSAFEENLEQSKDAFITRYPSDQLRPPHEFTQLLDQQALYFRDGFYYMVKLFSKRTPFPFPSYQFEASENGVSVEGYICRKNERVLIGSAHGGLGKETLNDRLQKEIIAKIKPFCSDDNHFETVRDHAKKSKYHGEEAWMVEFVPKLMKELKGINKNKFIHETRKFFDDKWLQNFTHFPRIEFVLNTSPCEHCQKLFKNLRTILNQEGFYIPVIIYSIYPFNKNETEMSQVNILSFEGEFIKTDIFMDTKYNKIERPAKDISSFANLEDVLLFNKKVFPLLSELNKIMGDSIQQQFFSGLLHYLKVMDLSKADIALFKDFLNRFPIDLRSKAPQEYQECIDYIQKNTPSGYDSIFTSENINRFFNHILPQNTNETIEDFIKDNDTEWDSISSISDENDFDSEDFDMMLTFFMIFSYANPNESQNVISLNMVMSVLIYTILKKIKQKNINELEPPIIRP